MGEHVGKVCKYNSHNHYPWAENDSMEKVPKGGARPPKWVFQVSILDHRAGERFTRTKQLPLPPFGQNPEVHCKTQLTNPMLYSTFCEFEYNQDCCVKS